MSECSSPHLTALNVPLGTHCTSCVCPVQVVPTIKFPTSVPTLAGSVSSLQRGSPRRLRGEGQDWESLESFSVHTSYESLGGDLRVHSCYLQTPDSRCAYIHISICICTIKYMRSFLCSIKLAAATDTSWPGWNHAQGHHRSCLYKTLGKFLLKERPHQACNIKVSFSYHEHCQAQE